MRRRRRGLPFKRVSRQRHVINIAERSLAANTTETLSLILSDDTPSPTVISDGTTIAECEEGSRVIPRKLKIAFTSAVSDPVAVAFLVWKDGSFGAPTDPTTAQDVVSAGSALQSAALKKFACMYQKFWLSPNSDQKNFFIRIPKRLRRLRQGESIKLTVTNLEAATDAIEYFVQGQIVSLS